MPAFFSQGCVELEKHLDATDLEQKDFAKIAGIDAGFLNHLLRGRKRPSLDTAVKLREATGIDPEAWTLTPPEFKQLAAKRARIRRRRQPAQKSA